MLRITTAVVARKLANILAGGALTRRNVSVNIPGFESLGFRFAGVGNKTQERIAHTLKTGNLFAINGTISLSKTKSYKSVLNCRFYVGYSIAWKVLP